MGHLTRFFRDDAGGMVDEIVAIGILILVGGAILVSLAEGINGAIAALGSFVDSLMPM